MAIFGKFTDIPMPDLLSLIAPSTGTLVISRYEATQMYLISVQNRKFTRLLFNNQEVVYPDQAISFITELIQTNEGDFEFQRGEVTSGEWALPIQELLHNSLAMMDELLAYRAHLPDPQTVFVTSEQKLGWMNPDLNLFWENAHPFFIEGASALDVQDRLGLFLEQVQLKLYKLRSLGLLVPKRVFQVAPPVPVAVPISIPPPSVESTLTLPADPLNIKLQPIWSDAPANPILKPSKLSLQKVEMMKTKILDVKKIVLKQEKKTIATNLMNALAQKKSANS